MRIVLITHFFPPGHVGGTEVLSLGLAKQLQSLGHQVQVVCAADWDSAPSAQIRFSDEIVEEVAVRRLRFNWMKSPDVFRYLYDNPEVEGHITALLNQWAPDIVHITSCYSLSASVIMAAQQYGVPVVLTATDFWFLCARNTLLQTDDALCAGPETPWKCARCVASDAKIYRWPRQILPEPAVATLLEAIGRYPLLTRQPGLRGMLGPWDKRQSFLAQALTRVDRIVTASHLLSDMFIEHGVSPERISVSPYGLDTSWAAQYPAKRPSDRLRIGFIGQILPFKGPDLLIQAVRQLDPGLPIDVLIYGDLAKTPDYGARLRTLAGQDPRFHFLGTFDNSRIGEVFTGIDVLAVPSTWYDFPLVITSALATNTPVLATNLSGMNELVEHECNGLLFERYDWRGLAQQIERLLTEPELLSRLRAGIRPVKTIAQMVEEYCALYGTLISRRDVHAPSTERAA
jgi:glycosyltransferase involved in cell wall biosynthesis